MAYIRYGTILPSEIRSTSFVIGDPDGLVNFEGEGRIPYKELVNYFQTKSFDEILSIIKKKLKLSEEEAKCVSEGLLEEYKNGGWDQVPDYSVEENKDK